MSADDESHCIVVLGSHHWAVLVWRLVEISLGRELSFFTLGDQGCQFEFVYCFSEWHALPCTVKWFEGGERIVLQKVGQVEAVPKNCLRFSNSFTYNDLVCLANECGIAKAKNKPRAEILTAIALKLGDEDFAALVVDQDTKSKKGQLNGGLVQCLYDQLDADEKKEFSSMKDIADKNQKAAVQKKWQNLLKERADEVTATQLIV